jgi:hypothetical protein
MILLDRRRLIFGAACLGLHNVESRAAGTLPPADIARKAAELDQVAAWTAEMTLEMLEPGGSRRVRRGTLWNKLRGSARDGMRLFRVTHPADIAGTAVLTHEHADRPDDTWLYLPVLKKARRIVGGSRRDSFLGSAFTYVDMARPRVSLYTYEHKGRVQVAGTDCHVIEGRPASKQALSEEGYSLVRSFVAEGSFKTLQVHYHDEQGRQAKTQTLGDYTALDEAAGRWVPRRREMVNHANGQHSVVVLSSIDARPSLSDHAFSEARLAGD